MIALKVWYDFTMSFLMPYIIYINTLAGIPRYFIQNDNC